MYENQFITWDEYQAALDPASAHVLPQSPESTALYPYPHYVEYAVRDAVQILLKANGLENTSANRTKNISNARQIAMYLCRKLLDSTYDDIGREFGGRDHSTVMSSCENVERKIKTDPLYLKAINEIESKIK